MGGTLNPITFDIASNDWLTLFIANKCPFIIIGVERLKFNGERELTSLKCIKIEIVPFDVVEEFEFPLVGEIDSLSLGGVVRGCF
jgi:hypothetical protein